MRLQSFALKSWPSLKIVSVRLTGKRFLGFCPFAEAVQMWRTSRRPLSRGAR